MNRLRKTSVALVVFPMGLPMIRYADPARSIDEEDGSRGQVAGRGSGEGPGSAPADRRGRGAPPGARGQSALRLPELFPEDEPVDAARAHPETGVDHHLQ